MRTRMLKWCLGILALGLAASACTPFSVEFHDPRPGALSPPDVEFVLKLPEGPGEVILLLDGAPVEPEVVRRKPGVLEGTLRDVAPGARVLSALFAPPVGPTVRTEVAFEVAGAADFEVRGSVEQVFVTHAEPGQPLVLRNRLGFPVEEGQADAQGSLIFRGVKPLDVYRVSTAGPAPELSRPVTVMSVEGSTPPQSFYDAQVLEPGFGYITTRDGTKLSVFVSLPGPVEDGPYPTLVNYSGYDPSQPGGPLSLGGLDLTQLCDAFPVFCAAPNHPSGLIAGVLGYATVGVNLRGTGCSGGAYDFFEPLQVLDGYDVIEAVAAQPWVKGHRVGMVGLSYPGISQLFVAAARPPSLSAITPLSVISGVDTTLAPGGIINNGFALEWGQEVLDKADPYGRGWERDVVDAGDAVCEENQLLHSQKVDIIQKALDNPFYTPEVYDPLNPRTFVDRIDVPVFTAGAWQDEQTGGHFPILWDRFTSAPVTRFTGYNGAHADAYAPQVLVEWKTFLDFYVAEEIVPIPMLVQLFGPLLFQEIFGAQVDLPDLRYAGAADFQAARTAYEAEPDVRIIFESGADPEYGPGAPSGAFEAFFSEWPPPETAPERLYLHADGTLRDFPPSEAESASRFRHDDDKGQETYQLDGSFENAQTEYTWHPWEPERQVVFATEPLLEDAVLLGSASADLWIRSTADDADLEVMLSEIRPDGEEVYVTSGWLRASRRALSPESTPLRPVQTHVEEDAAPLPAGQWELVRVELYPFAHVFRAGSRIRVSVSTPGGNKGRWRFDVLPLGEGVFHQVSHSAAHPSSVLLPVIPGLSAPTPLPACPGLRSQPCREHVAHTNDVVD